MFDKNFLLRTKTAQKLFFKYAKDLPIYDYHCHLNPKEIVDNKEFENIGEMWLSADHYKWRLMRQNGVDERYITGDAPIYEKFERFVGCIELAIGNPLYHWCHLELQRYFNCDLPLKKENAKKIWDACEKIKYTPQQLIKMSNVKLICTTDHPNADLEYHQKLKVLDAKILPTFRPDISELQDNIIERMDYFHQNGCRLSDHSVDVWNGKVIENLITLGKEYLKRGWIMQLHIGALRNNNSRLFSALGADSGFDSINDAPLASNISKVLDGIGGDIKTILYSLNPNDNAMLATMTGNFRNVRHGSAWWFNDTFDGMREHMKTLANMGALNKFIGMLTDSRSFLSYTRHEYFRRILCGLVGDWVEAGHFPNDENILKKIIENICYYNTVEYFNLED